jgi:predicted  nucleic acid-binding Zn-ribbon protein
MKKTILLQIASILIFGVILTGCYSSAEKVENAQNKVSDANDDLNKANQEYLADVENYKIEVTAKIEANNKSIAELKERMKNKKQDTKNDYKKRIAVLEQRNSDLKYRIDNYKAEGKDKWEQFKEEFNRDMENLGQAFKDITVDNVK